MNIIKILQESIFNNNSSVKDAIKFLNKTGKRICLLKVMLFAYQVDTI
jgi:hypothetical protein